jgi:hypothetical protein
MHINIKIIILLLVWGSSHFHAQGQRFFVPSSHYKIDYQKHAGNLILKNGEVITGVFQYAYLEFPTPNFKLYSDSGKLLKRYKLSAIKSITLAGSDTTLSDKDSTYFMRLGNASFYRQLTFGMIRIYDPLINVNEKKGLVYSDLAVEENNSIKVFHVEDHLLRYIEKKLKEKKIYKTFHSIKEAIRLLNATSG